MQFSLDQAPLHLIIVLKLPSSRVDEETSHNCPVQSAGRRSDSASTYKSLRLCLHTCRLKCDRQKPCHNCIKRGQPGSCDYVKHDPSRPKPTTTNVQDRIRQLEDKVVALLNSQTSQATPSAEASASAASPKEDDGFTQSAYESIPKGSPGVFTRTNNQVNFVGSEHWESVLEDITELKIDLETDSAMTDFKPQILFGTNLASRSDLLSSIPSRPVCDALVSRWFRSM